MVVIDLLRATTTITYALAAGAERVIPCGEMDEALRIREELAGRQPKVAALLGGERGGLKIEDFDLGNSPGEFTAERVAGRTIVFTTTNGTRAMLHCRQAERVLLGALVNLRAVAASAYTEDMHILSRHTGRDHARGCAGRGPLVHGNSCALTIRWLPVRGHAAN